MSTPVGNALALAKLAADRRAGATALPVQRGIRREPVRREPDTSEPSLFDAVLGQGGDTE